MFSGHTSRPYNTRAICTGKHFDTWTLYYKYSRNDDKNDSSNYYAYSY